MTRILQQFFSRFDIHIYCMRKRVSAAQFYLRKNTYTGSETVFSTTKSILSKCCSDYLVIYFG